MSFSYNPPKCKKCGGRISPIPPTCGLGWEFETMFDTEEDYTCKCTMLVRSYYNPEEKEDE